jgi:hypothetical protein
LTLAVRTENFIRLYMMDRYFGKDFHSNWGKLFSEITVFTFAI